MKKLLVTIASFVGLIAATPVLAVGDPVVVVDNATECYTAEGGWAGATNQVTGLDSNYQIYSIDLSGYANGGNSNVTVNYAGGSFLCSANGSTVLCSDNNNIPANLVHSISMDFNGGNYPNQGIANANVLSGTGCGATSPFAMTINFVPLNPVSVVDVSHGLTGVIYENVFGVITANYRQLAVIGAFVLGIFLVWRFAKKLTR